MPNWLGDMVMATAFVNGLRKEYPQAVIDLIVKKELLSVAALIPDVKTIYPFSKKENSSRRFGKMIGRQKKYDLFFCLPNSFSSAQMAFSSGAKKRIGFKKELRSVFLTDSYRIPANMHRVEEYLHLLSSFTKRKLAKPVVQLEAENIVRRNAVVVNINSEAISRRLPVEKAVEVINLLRKEISAEIILIGSPKEKAYVSEVFENLADKQNIINIAGTTSLPETVSLLASVKAVLTTDSGPAHISNAVGTPTVVLFGAGNENSTAPFNENKREVIRLEKLACEKCVSNTCKPYGLPKCLQDLDVMKIIAAVKKYL